MSPVTFSPQVQHVLRTDVYDAIRKAVIAGLLKPGERVNEAEIARQMQISRAPIREAIRQLEQEGLLVTTPYRGTFVMTLSRDDVEEVYTLRADIEMRAVRRALQQLASDDFATLERLIESMMSAAEAKDMTALLEADIQFHRSIVEKAGWPRLRKFWESLHPQTLTLYTMTTLSHWSLVSHAERHRPVLDALRTGDPDDATTAIQNHILDICAEIVRYLPSSE